MRSAGGKGQAQVLALAVDSRPRRGRIRAPLTTSAGILHELSRVYRAARRGELPTSEASRLAFVLGTMAKIVESVVFEERLDRLERMNGREISNGPSRVA